MVVPFITNEEVVLEWMHFTTFHAGIKDHSLEKPVGLCMSGHHAIRSEKLAAMQHIAGNSCTGNCDSHGTVGARGGI